MISHFAANNMQKLQKVAKKEGEMKDEKFINLAPEYWDLFSSFLSLFGHFCGNAYHLRTFKLSTNSYL